MAEQPQLHERHGYLRLLQKQGWTLRRPSTNHDGSNDGEQCITEAQHAVGALGPLLVSPVLG